MTTSIARRVTLTAFAALATLAGSHAAAQADPPKLAPAYEGSWDNLEAPASGSLRITIDKVDADGTVTGTYTRDAAKVCATKNLAFKGRLDGNALELVPDFGTDFRCKDTRWGLTLQADGTLAGTGQSYYSLKASLKPVAK